MVTYFGTAYLFLVQIRIGTSNLVRRLMMQAIINR